MLGRFLSGGVRFVSVARKVGVDASVNHFTCAVLDTITRVRQRGVVREAHTKLTITETGNEVKKHHSGLTPRR